MRSGGRAAGRFGRTKRTAAWRSICSIDQAIDQALDQALDQTAEQPQEHHVDQPAEQGVRQHVHQVRARRPGAEYRPDLYSKVLVTDLAGKFSPASPIL